MPETICLKTQHNIPED